MLKINMDDTLIKDLVISFFKGSLPNLKDKDINMTWDIQESFLKQTIYSSLYKKYPGSPSFTKLYFKKLINSLEPKQEVHDDIYEYLCSLMENDAETGFHYHHYLIDNSLDSIVTIKETKNMVLNGTTGLRTWEAALMLTDWALDNKEIFSKKKILELGSGVGFTGITIAKYCNVKSMVMTDCHEEVLDTIRSNLQINFLASKLDSTVYENEEKYVGVMKLDWNDTENLAEDLEADIIIGADIVYDPTILQPLMSVFDFFLNRNKNTIIYIASVIRNNETFNGFLKILESSKFKYTTISLTKNAHIQWDESLEKCLLRINKG